MIIYFSAQLPSNKVPVAGQKVAWNNLIELGDPKGIILFSFVNKIEKSFFDEDLYCHYKKTYFKYLNKTSKIKNYLFNLNFPFKVSGRYSDLVFGQLVREVKKNKVQKIFFEFTSSMLYAKKIKELYPNIEIHFVEHDVTFQSYFRLSRSSNYLKKIFYYFEFRRMKSFELNNLNKFNYVYTLNLKDYKFLKEYHINNVSVKYPKVEDWIYTINRTKIKKESILFLGAMHRKENQDAVIWFVNNVIPTLVFLYPELKFYIVGSGVTEKIKLLQNNNVIVTGYVKNLRDYFEMVQIAVVPLRFGAGIKIKTVETVTAKILTIATDIGAEGVNQNDYLKIANSKEDFISLIKKEFKNV
jgi:polysaccharide biosynthesis protein PslH